jgi:hypothetical protein
VLLHRLYGCQFAKPGAVGTTSGVRTAAVVCQGGAPKRYAYTDPNEDAVLLAEDNDRLLLAVADAHGGSIAGEIALEHLAATSVDAWMSNGMDGGCWRTEATSCFVAIHQAIQRENRLTGRSSFTTLVVCLADLQCSLAYFACVGDSIALLLGPSSARWAFDSNPRDGCFLGNPQLDIELLPSYCPCKLHALEGITAVLLATDGISTIGVGFDDPLASILEVAQTGPCTLPTPPAPLALAHRVVQAARLAQKRNDAGDNIAVAAIVLVPSNDA